MDIPALTDNAVDTLTPYFIKSAEAFASEAGKEAVRVAKTIYERIRQRLANGVGASELSEFESDPKGKAEALKAVLEMTLRGDSVFATELRELLEANKPVIKVIQRIAIGLGPINGLYMETDRIQEDVHVIQRFVVTTNETTGATIINKRPIS